MKNLLRIFWLLCVVILTVASARGEAARFELRGILDLGGSRSFSLKDTETGGTFWIELGRTLGGVHAHSYDASEKVLLLEEDGLTHRLRLAEANNQPLLVMTDQVVAQQQAAEEKRIAAPTQNPRLRSLIVERRRQGIIKPVAAGANKTSQHFAAGSGAHSVSEGNENSSDPSASPAQASKPVPAPYPAPPEGMRYNGGPDDPNPRILSKNEIRYPSRTQ